MLTFLSKSKKLSGWVFLPVKGEGSFSLQVATGPGGKERGGEEGQDKLRAEWALGRCIVWPRMETGSRKKRPSNGTHHLTTDSGLHLILAC